MIFVVYLSSDFLKPIYIPCNIQDCKEASTNNYFRKQTCFIWIWGKLYDNQYLWLKLIWRGKCNAGGTDSIFKGIWDWETESKVWEAYEDMERWAIEVRQRTSAKR